MIRSEISFLSICLLLLSPYLPTLISAQFGIPKVPASLPEQNGDQIYQDSTTTTTPQQGFLSDTDAANMELLITEAKKDLETMQMITQLKSENSQYITELQSLPPEQIIGGMKEAMDNMKLIEYLFQDKERAVREMEKEGMIDKKHLKKYRKDPELLEMDTRRGLYFQFISMAVVGGFFD